MYFDGRGTTSKPHVLGGKSKVPESREIMLARTQAEREQRLLFKRQTKAALDIQRCFRGHTIRRVTKQNFFVLWSLPDSRSDLLIPALRQFLYFYSAQDVRHRDLLDSMCSLLLENLHLVKAVSPSQLQKLTRSCCITLPYLSPDTPISAFKMAELLLSPHEFGLCFVSSTLSSCLRCDALFSSLANYLCNHERAKTANIQILRRCLGFIALPFTFPSFPHTSLATNHFFNHFLPHINLSNPIYQPILLLFSNLFMKILKNMPFDVHSLCLSLLGRKGEIRVIFNCLHLVQENTPIPNSLVSLLASLLPSLSENKKNNTNNIDAMEDNEPDTPYNYNNNNNNNNKEAMEDKEKDTATLEIYPLLRSHFLNKKSLRSALLPSAPLLDFCIIVNIILQNDPSQEPFICGLFAFHSNFILECWHSLEPNLCLASPFEDMLILWARIFTRSLLVIDDHEFFHQCNPSQPFSISNILAMTSALDTFLLKIYTATKTNTSPLLKKCVCDILRHLHARLSRFNYFTTTPAEKDIFFAFLNNQMKISLENPKNEFLLHEAPFLFPFEDRARRFFSEIEKEKESSSHFGYRLGLPLTIRRNYIFEDGYAEFTRIRSEDNNGSIGNLKKRFEIEFINQQGMPEAGIDGGGLFKDFIHELSKTAFGPNYGLFKTNEHGLLFPNPSSLYSTADFLAIFEFLGALLGKALYEGVLIELPFTSFFLAKLLGIDNQVYDLIYYDRLLWKNLKSIKDTPHVEELELTFNVCVNEFDESTLHDLIPNGREISVTNENKIEYIYRVSDFYLNRQIHLQSRAFLRGFHEIIPREMISVFNQEELQLLISGMHSEIDLVDWRLNTQYSGGYSDSHPVIEWFWQIVDEISSDDQSKLLMFVTCISKPPLLGFKHLHPSFAIQMVPRSDSSLPSALTCMNLLKLPQFSSREKLKEKLLYAIRSNTGFELS